MAAIKSEMGSMQHFCIIANVRDLKFCRIYSQLFARANHFIVGCAGNCQKVIVISMARTNGKLSWSIIVQLTHG